MDATRVRYREQLFVTMPRGARSPPTRLPPGPSRRWQLCSGPDLGAVERRAPRSRRAPHVHADISRCGRGQIDFPSGLRLAQPGRWNSLPSTGLETVANPTPPATAARPAATDHQAAETCWAA